MVHELCAVFDQMSQLYGRPFAVPHLGVATREFGDAVNSPESDMSKHPDHYTLFSIGKFDDVTGIVTSEVKTLGNGIQFVKALDNGKAVKLA